MATKTQYEHQIAKLELALDSAHKASGKYRTALEAVQESAVLPDDVAAIVDEALHLNMGYSLPSRYTDVLHTAMAVAREVTEDTIRELKDSVTAVGLYFSDWAENNKPDAIAKRKEAAAKAKATREANKATESV